MNKNIPATILIDASDIDKPSGGRTAVLELFRELFARESDWRFIVLVSQREPDFEVFPHVRQVTVPFRNRILERLWIQVAVMYFVFVKGVQLAHFARTIGSLVWGAKSVITIFDITPLHYPKLHSKTTVWFLKYVHPFILRRTDRLIAISNNVKDDLVHDFHLPPDRIKVVYCAPKSIFSTPTVLPASRAALQKYQLPERYILFVGMLAKKKNLPTLIEALHILKTTGFQCPPLVIAGRRYRQSDATDIFEQIHTLGLDEEVRYIGPVEDVVLPALYRGSDAFIFPSLHEGFGIPCLEAMMCRVPLVATRSGAIPEIVGDAALLVDDPTDAYALAQAIQRILSDTDLRHTLVTNGALWVEQFTWPHLADKVVAVYKDLLEK